MARERARRAVLEVRAHRAVRLPVWLLPMAIALVVLIEAAVLVRQTPPVPKPLDAPDTEFSAHRARAVLERVLGDGAPRPTGSAANARAREAILAELSALGHGASVETGMVCGQWSVCAHVSNVVSRIAGREPGRAVLLSAHYDSVPAAPGAADDGSGVAAILEIARVLKHVPPRRPVVLLLGDGEELGLLGAELFVRESRYFAEVDAVVNLEARGSSGPSLMFETSGGNAGVIGAFAGAVPRPLTSSAFYEVYRRLPNDSDFSVFKAHGLVGYNFAFIGDMSRYHTPRDELSALDLKSLQHHGDNALSSLRALSEAPGHSDHDAVFFDVLGWRLVWWKGSLSPWFAGGAAFLLLLALAVGVLRGAFRADSLLLSLLLVPAALAAATVVTLGLELALHALGALPSAWVAHPEPTLAACAVIAAGAVTGLAAAAGPERAAALWGAIWTWFCVGAGTAVATLPGASFLLLVPALAAGLFGLLWFAFPRKSALWSSLAALVPVLATALLWLPKLSLLYTAVGFASLPAFCLAFTLPALSLAPLLATPAGSLRRAVLISAAILIPACGVTARLVPRASPDNPARLSLAFHQDVDTGAARYLADVSWAPLPPALAEAGLEFVAADPRPWTAVRRAVAAPAPKLALPAPEFAVASSEAGERGGRRVRGRLRSPRGAPMIRLELSRPIKLKVGGVKASSRFESPSYASTFILADPGGVELELEIESAEKVSALIVDHSYGLPAEARELARLRGDAAVPFHFGDATVVSKGALF